MVKRNAIATKLTKRCTQTQKRAFDVALLHFEDNMTCGDGDILNNSQKRLPSTMLRSTSSQDKETVKRPKRKL